MKCFPFFVLIVLFWETSASDNIEIVEAVVGQSAELPCNVSAEIEDDKLNIIAWYKNGSSTAFYSRDFRQDGKAGSSTGRYRLLRSGTDDAGTDLLQIASVRPADAGLYTCHVDFESSPSLKTYVQVNVIDPPQRLWVIHENGTRLATASAGSNASRSIGPYYVGDTVHLFCVAFGGKPQPILSWWAGRRLLKESSTPLSEQRVRSDVMYGPLEREDHGLPLSCQAGNNNTTLPLAIDLIVDMHLSPMLISVRSPANKLGGRVRAGEPLDMQCRVLGARPPPPVEWRLDDARLANLEQNITTDMSQRLMVSEVQLTLGPEHDESQLTCCVPTYQRAGETFLCAQSFPITVRYKPIVQILVSHDLNNNTMAVVKGSDVVLNCTYDANPDARVLVWYFQDDILVKHTDGDLTPTLTLSQVSDENAGEYGCEVGNEEGTTYSGESVVIDVTYPAYCEETDVVEYGLREDEYLNITCNVKGNPVPTQYRWVLVNDSVTVNTIRNTSQTTLETYEPTLLYQRPSSTPFTTVFCWGMNGVPSSGLPHTPCISLITDETPPRPPSDCVATRADSRDITISCEKGYDGGLPQHFKFIVKPIDKDKHQDEIVSITKVEPSFIIQEPAEEKYKFVIVAINDKGESSEVEIAMEDIVDENPEASPKSAITNITTLALALCGGVALLALAACGLVLCARERAGSRLDLPHLRDHPPLCAYNTEESNCETYHGSDDGSECNVRRTDSFRRAVSRYPSRNFDVRRTSSFHSARYMNDMAEQEAAKCGDMMRHNPGCRVHSLQNINKKRDMDTLCDHLVMHLPNEVNYNVPRPMNTFYTMPRKMRHKLAKELSDEASEITQTSDGFSLPPPPDEYGTYRAGTRIKDVPKATPTYSTVVKKNSAKEPKSYNNVIISPMNTVSLPTVSGAHNSVYSYPDDDQRGQVSTNPFGEDEDSS